MKGLLIVIIIMYVMIPTILFPILLLSSNCVASPNIISDVDNHDDDLQSSDISSPSQVYPITWDTTLYLKKRVKRQEEGGLDDESKSLSEGVCDFGTNDGLVTCSWYVPTDAHPLIRWKVGSGTTSYWLGGPTVDKTSGENTGKSMYTIFWAFELDFPPAYSLRFFPYF